MRDPYLDHLIISTTTGCCCCCCLRLGFSRLLRRRLRRRLLRWLHADEVQCQLYAKWQKKFSKWCPPNTKTCTFGFSFAVKLTSALSSASSESSINSREMFFRFDILQYWLICGCTLVVARASSDIDRLVHVRAARARCMTS